VSATAWSGVARSAPSNLAEVCANVTSPIGRDLAELGDDSYLFITIVPLQVGSIEIRGVRIGFDEGVRRGSQHTGPTVRLQAVEKLPVE